MGDDDDNRAPPPPPASSESHEPLMPPVSADEPSPRDVAYPQQQQQLDKPEDKALSARDTVVITTAHHQSDVEPMSAQMEKKASSDTIKTYVDLERVRIKMEVACMRASGPLREIPSGRVFDSPPSGTSDAIDDRTVKAEAAVDLSLDNVERIRSEGHDTDHDDLPVKKDAKTRAMNNLDLIETTTHNAKVRPRDDDDAAIVTATALSHSKVATDTEIEKQTDKRDNHNLIDSPGKGSESPQTGAALVAKPSQKEPEQKSHSINMILSDHSNITNTESVADPSSARSPPKHDATDSGDLPAQLKPHATTVNTSNSSRNVSKLRTVPDENRPLNEYLVSELQLFSSVMLGEKAPTEVSRRSSCAVHATTLQLYYDHTRALRDFDADWRRSHVGTKGSWTRLRTGGSPISKSKDAGTDLAENPFKKHESESKTTGWGSILESVRLQSTAKADQLKLKSRSDDAVKVDRMYQRGLNGLVVSDKDGDQHRQQLCAFVIDLAQRQKSPGLHIVIASNSALPAWKSELAAGDQIEVYPYWGEKGDREQILTVLGAEYLSRQKPKPHVLLTSFDIFAEDVRVLGIIQWQLALVEVPEAVVYQEQLKAVWMQMLCLRARHRLLISHEGFHIDTRRILQFLLPGLFSSRRKLLAWNCAAFDVDLIHRMCDTIESFTVMSDQRALQAFLATTTQYSIIKSGQELSTLSVLDRSGAFRRTVSTRVKDEDVKPRESKSPKNRNVAAPSLKVKARRLSDDLSIQLAHKKRRGSDGTPRSRKRISRCGKCAGCLAEDCMTCGHCQDMKKYGGPGLRKQSCKNRKCINPRRWGMAVRKSKRAKVTKQQPGKGENDEGDEETMSEKYETDLDGDEHDDGAASYYSQDSDRDSTFSASASHDVVNSDSDGHDFLRSSEELPASPRDVNLMSTEKLQDDDFESKHVNGSYGGSGSKSSRTRVMRCGKCAGCTASDCLTCLHCLDMKKYGGPGLRKQSCKNRKCIVPKVVLLNQSKDGEFVDEKGNVVHPDYYEGVDALDGAVLYHMNGNLGARTAMISLIQECEIFIDRHLVFACEFCVARFSSRGLLELHERVEHLPPGVENHCDALEKEASRMLLHPVQQNCLINAQLRENKKTLRSCPRAYVKLEGTDFQYFMMQPYLVLGRLDSRWRDFYKDLGITSTNGLGGGGVDCQIGDNNSISEKHALISWNFKAKHFTIECLSVEVPISVNDRKVRFEEEPLTLQSQDQVQVGSSSFFFLLPKVSSDQSQRTAAEETLPRSELQAWLNAAMRKRRASASENSKADQANEVAAIKKRCHERLAAASST